MATHMANSTSLSPSGIAAQVLQAYRETEYRVLADPSFVLLIDCFSAPLASLHARHGVACSSFLTACNPYSQLADMALNVRRQQQLSADLQARGCVYYSGEGAHPSGSWPAEPSFLVLGLDRRKACALGQKYEQNAVLCCDAQAIPHLVLLR